MDKNEEFLQQQSGSSQSQQESSHENRQSFALAHFVMIVSGVIVSITLGALFRRTNTTELQVDPASHEIQRVASADIPISTGKRLIDAYSELPLSFEANRGQADEQVKFLCHGGGYTLSLTRNESFLVLQKQEVTSRDGHNRQIKSSQAATLRMSFVDANPASSISGMCEQSGKSNYFIGKDPAQWHVDIPNFGRVKCKNVFNGIDVVYYGDQRQLEYDFVVAPRVDPNVIKLRFKGAETIEIDDDGCLLLKTTGGNIRQRPPIAYQHIAGIKKNVTARYCLSTNNCVGFILGPYDNGAELTIDPILTYATYLGGSSYDSGNSIAVDGAGSTYITGMTTSVDFPLQNAIQTIYGGDGLHGGGDVFVTKLNAAGTAIVYSTYLGGSGSDQGYGIAVDGSGNAYVTGGTDSINFPLRNAFQGTFGGSGSNGGDAFVAKLNATGNSLIFSTFLGGTDDDVATGIALDGSGNAYITGNTLSKDFPVRSAFQATKPAAFLRNAFVAKLSSVGSLVYSTYLGGSSSESGNAIAVSSNGNAYVTGLTSSIDFPIVNALQSTLGGNSDAFVTKFNLAGNGLVYSTYLGGSGADTAYGIAVDSFGNAYITGNTTSTNFPIRNAFQATLGDALGSNGDAFVTKLSATGSALIYSTYLGGSKDDVGYGIALDGSGNAYITGYSQSSNFPLQSAFQISNSGAGATTFVTKLNSSGNNLIFSSYLGGNGIGNGIAVDGSENVFITGVTYSRTFPQSALQFGGGFADAFVAKISSTNPLPSISNLSPASAPAGQSITLTINGSGLVNGAVVGWNGSNCTTTYVSQTQLTASVPVSLLSVIGTANVTVFSPAPGGGLSNSVVFTIVKGTPVLTWMRTPVEKCGG